MTSRPLIAALIWIGLAAAPWSQAVAAVDPYNIILKDPAGGAVWGTGGLTFDNGLEAGGDGNYPPQPAPAPSITVTAGLRPFLLAGGGFTFDTIDTAFPLQVAVVTTSLLKPGTGGANELLKQGPNVEGLRFRITGTKNVTSGTTTVPVKLAMDFTLTAIPQGNGTTAFIRDFSIRTVNTTTGADGGIIATGKYHISNTRSIPEPGSLALLLAAAAAGLGLTRLRQRAANKEKQA